MRFPDWQDRLAAVVAQSRRPFAYGAHDCCLFAAACVKAITGTDYAADFRPYDRRRAAEIIGRHGGLAGLMDALLGPRQPRNAAREGDIALVRPRRREAVGVVVGTHVVLIQGVRAPLSSARHVWRVD